MPHSSSSQPRVLIVAFQGWSDAGDATSDVVSHLVELMGAEVLHVIGSEGYVDFQVHRPKLSFDGLGNRTIEWPDTKLLGLIRRPGLPGGLEVRSDSTDQIRRIDGTPVTDLFLLSGVEPARDWQNFADEIVEMVDVWGIDTVIILGSMYSDAPHSRPIVTSLSSSSPTLQAETGAEASTYEGPVGISSIIDMALVEAGVQTLSLWAQVPHYVHSSPSPKATLALLDKLEELLDLVIPRGDLLDQANEWEANINRIAEADEDMSRYIRKLEEHRDEALAAEFTGDAIARDFEKFLEGGRLGTESANGAPEDEASAEDARDPDGANGPDAPGEDDDRGGSDTAPEVGLDPER